jgi:phosphoribosylcarboxyaminoimidazole (NCAIR) mutase
VDLEEPAVVYVTTTVRAAQREVQRLSTTAARRPEVQAIELRAMAGGSPAAADAVAANRTSPFLGVVAEEQTVTVYGSQVAGFFGASSFF